MTERADRGSATWTLFVSRAIVEHALRRWPCPEQAERWAEEVYRDIEDLAPRGNRAIVAHALAFRSNSQKQGQICCGRLRSWPRVLLAHFGLVSEFSPDANRSYILPPRPSVPAGNLTHDGTDAG